MIQIAYLDLKNNGILNLNDFLHLQLIRSLKKDKFDKITHPKAQSLSLAGYLLLIYLLKENKIDLNLEIVTSPLGKPYFKQEKIFFNISHSRNIICTALADKEIGIDIQFKKETDFLKIAERFFHKSEIEKIKNSSGSAHLFYELWTAKEAYLKFKGIGLREKLDSFQFEEALDFWKIKSSQDISTIIKHYQLKENYFLALAFENFDQPKIDFKELTPEALLSKLK